MLTTFGMYVLFIYTAEYIFWMNFNTNENITYKSNLIINNTYNYSMIQDFMIQESIIWEYF